MEINAVTDQVNERAGEVEAVEAEAPDELAELKQQLEAAQAKAAENLDGWQRALADLANYRKRVERERAEARQATAGAVVARLLPVLDDFDRAMKDAPDAQGAPEVQRWIEGIALIQRKLHAIVESEGVTPIEADNAMFDPNWHEAITHDESADHKEGQVIEVIRQGYRMGDRVLRPALVRVAK
jgi:molecular chaperone GrpE